MKIVGEKELVSELEKEMGKELVRELEKKMGKEK